jgi:hypothetical protein
MTFAEDKPVATLPPRISGVVAHLVKIESGDHVDDGQ